MDGGGGGEGAELCGEGYSFGAGLRAPPPRGMTSLVSFDEAAESFDLMVSHMGFEDSPALGEDACEEGAGHRGGARRAAGDGTGEGAVGGAEGGADGGTEGLDDFAFLGALSAGGGSRQPVCGPCPEAATGPKGGVHKALSRTVSSSIDAGPRGRVSREASTSPAPPDRIPESPARFRAGIHRSSAYAGGGGGAGSFGFGGLGGFGAGGRLDISDDLATLDGAGFAMEPLGDFLPDECFSMC